MFKAYKGVLMSILSEILSSRARAEFFSLLFGIDANELHLRDIQRKSGLAIGTIRQEAAKLERLGLVLKRQDGNRTYYSANRQNPLFGTIHDFVMKTTGLGEMLRHALSVEGVVYAFVFGSVAAGTQNAESDIDLFVIGEIRLRALSKLLKEPTLKTGREINPHSMTVEEFERRMKEKEHFVSSVMESPKLMIIGSEDDLRRLGE
jgi:predicted nucleotidyltransferase